MSDAHTERLNAERQAFEDAAFSQRFLSGLTRNPDTNAQFPAFMVDCPMQSDFVAKNEDGTYKEDSLNPAWWAWQRRGKTEQEDRDALIDALRDARQFVGNGVMHFECAPGESDRECLNRNRAAVASRIDALLAKHTPKVPA